MAKIIRAKIRRNWPLLKGWVDLRLNITSKGMILIQFAARRFYTKKFCSRLYSIELEFCSQKTTNSLFVLLSG